MPLLPKSARSLTGWAKATAISATLLLIACGLCGLNYGAFAAFNLSIGGSADPLGKTHEQLSGILVLTAFAEAAAIVLSAAALLISVLGLLVTSVFKRKP